MAMGAHTSMSSCFHLHKEVFARLNRETAEADTVNCSLAKGHSDLCFDAHGTSDVSFGGFMYII